MTTTTYQWSVPAYTQLMNTAITAGDQTHPAIAGFPKSGLFVLGWTTPGPDIEGRGAIGLGNDYFFPYGGERALSISAQHHEQDVSIAALSNGSFVATYTDTAADPSGDIRASRFYASFGPTADFGVDISAGSKVRESHVTALVDGGYVVTWTRDLGGNDNDILAKVYNADDSVRSATVVNNNGENTSHSSVAGLAGGGFVTVWEESPGAGGASEVRFRLFNAQGQGQDGTDQIGMLIDNAGSINRDIQVAGLPDGGFVAAYTDNGWGTGTDITAKVFNADGSARTGYIKVNNNSAAGDQALPSLTVLQGGDFVVGWKDVATNVEHVQAFDPADGHAIGPGTVVQSGVVEGEIAALSGGNVAMVLESLAGDSSGTSIQAMALELTRTIIGDNSNEVFQASPDGLSETIDAKGGDDTVVFAKNLDKYNPWDFGDHIGLSASKSSETLWHVEHLQFADGTITPDDGSALFDTVYYLRQNLDVFHANANALQHFNQSGWHEGRDPNIFFSVTGYLGANPDVKAANINPLDHYDQAGWKEGRDPGPYFDTKLYLIHNPDVAAAGVDPLAHYLQSGQAEGREIYDAIGSTIANGFDAEYYLFHNPDVAAANVDPLQHFLTIGWTEGRDPNGWFDTKGYLAHYADVAAANVNPLLHYEQSGWKEGRDPSTKFDTLGYLASNPDIVAAHVNPLDHYLQSGIYEDRTFANDYLWH